MPPQMGIQIAAIDSIQINPLVDSFYAQAHMLIFGVINDQSPDDFLRRPVFDEFALNIMH
jgi:hypothetical protein